MRNRLSLLIIAFGFIVAATGVAVAQIGVGGAGHQRGMEELNNSGEAGFVTVFATRDNRSLVVLRIEGEPPGRVQPAHVHRGVCPNIDPKPAFPLNPVVNGRSATVIDISMARLLSGNYSVNVHASSQNLRHYVSCGWLTPGT